MISRIIEIALFIYISIPLCLSYLYVYVYFYITLYCVYLFRHHSIYLTVYAAQASLGSRRWISFLSCSSISQLIKASHYRCRLEPTNDFIGNSVYFQRFGTSGLYYVYSHSNANWTLWLVSNCLLGSRSWPQNGSDWPFFVPFWDNLT